MNSLLDHVNNHYSLGLSGIELIRESSDNIVYRIYGQDNKYILRWSKRSNRESLQEETKLLEMLSVHNYPVPSPVRNNENGFLTMYGNDTYVIFSFMEGESVVVSPDSKPDQSQAHQAGVYLAKYHNLVAGTKLSLDRDRKMTTELNRFLELGLDRVESSFANGNLVYRRVEYLLGALQDISYKQTYIHNDFRPQNIFFKDGVISAVLDFDWVCLGAREKDLAHTVVEWSQPDGLKEPWLDIAKSVLEGYYSEAVEMESLTAEEFSFWAELACLSDACTYWADNIKDLLEDSNPDKMLRSYMYGKSKWWSSNSNQII